MSGEVLFVVVRRLALRVSQHQTIPVGECPLLTLFHAKKNEPEARLSKCACDVKREHLRQQA